MSLTHANEGQTGGKSPNPSPKNEMAAAAGRPASVVACLVIWDLDSCRTTIDIDAACVNIRNYVISTHCIKIASFLAIYSPGHGIVTADLLRYLQDADVECVAAHQYRKPVLKNSIIGAIEKFTRNHHNGGTVVIVFSRQDLSHVRDSLRDEGHTVHLVDPIIGWPKVVSGVSEMANKPARGTPVGVFWDIENIGVPNRLSIAEAIARLRVKFGEAATVVVTMASTAAAVARKAELQQHGGGVRLIIPPGDGPEIADEYLMIEMARWARRHPPPATIVLISNDTDFTRPLAAFMNGGYYVVRAILPNGTWGDEAWRVTNVHVHVAMNTVWNAEPSRYFSVVGSAGTAIPASPAAPLRGVSKKEDDDALRRVNDRTIVEESLLPLFMKTLKSMTEREKEGIRRVGIDELRHRFFRVTDLVDSQGLFDSILDAARDAGFLVADGFVSAFDFMLEDVADAATLLRSMPTGGSGGGAGSDERRRADWTGDEGGEEEAEGECLTAEVNVICDVVKRLWSEHCGTAPFPQVFAMAKARLPTLVEEPFRRAVFQGVRDHLWTWDTRGMWNVLRPCETEDERFEIFVTVVFDGMPRIMQSVAAVNFWKLAGTRPSPGVVARFVARGVRESLWCAEGERGFRALVPVPSTSSAQYHVGTSNGCRAPAAARPAAPLYQHVSVPSQLERHAVNVVHDRQPPPPAAQEHRCPPPVELGVNFAHSEELFNAFRGVVHASGKDKLQLASAGAAFWDRLGVPAVKGVVAELALYGEHEGLWRVVENAATGQAELRGIAKARRR